MLLDKSVLKLLGISTSITLLFFAWQYNVGLSFWDEGFLWYGAQRTMLGEIPVLDFMAYDPGRYYWLATIMHLLNDNSIISCRAATGVFQVIVLFIGLKIIRNNSEQKLKISEGFFLIIVGLTLILWMYQWYKVFDIGCSVFLIATLKSIVEKPSRFRFFISGISLGLIAVIGKNHGAYGIISFIVLLFWLLLNNPNKINLFRSSLFGILGAIIGFSPILLMSIALPGFGKAFLENVLSFIRWKSTNISIAIPWPWMVDIQTRAFRHAIPDILISLFFLATLVFAVVSIVWIFYRKLTKNKVNPIIVAVSTLAFPYAQYAFSRADLLHLSAGIFPFLIGLFSFFNALGGRKKWIFSLILLMTTARVLFFAQPGYSCLVAPYCEEMELSGRTLRINFETKQTIIWLLNLANQYDPNGEGILITPFWPGAYSVLNRKSPIWENYALWPRDQNFEEKEIARIKKANLRLGIFLDFPLDGKKELHFKNTHPLIYQYLKDNFKFSPTLANPSIQILRPK